MNSGTSCGHNHHQNESVEEEQLPLAENEGALGTLSKRNHHANGKRRHGCRQIIFKLMRQRLVEGNVEGDEESSSAIHNTDEIFQHQEPCMFCRLSAKDSKETLQDLICKNARSESRFLTMQNLQLRENHSTISSSGSRRCEFSLLSNQNIMIRRILVPFLTPEDRKVLFRIPEFRGAFALDDYFCWKHGTKYVPDDKLFLRSARHACKKANTYGESKTYRPLGDIWKQIAKDGRDPVVFRNKLIHRTQDFPAEASHKTNDPTEYAEFDVSVDPDYAIYFKLMKKCYKCETEAWTRQQAKRGYVICKFCNTPYPHELRRNCENCKTPLYCKNCPDEALKEACRNCGKKRCRYCVLTCKFCKASTCKTNCQKPGKLKFTTCSVCRKSVCNLCDGSFTCQVCKEEICRECKEGGVLSCDCGAILSCETCKPQMKCDFCQRRKCLSCCDKTELRSCSICGGRSCDRCAGLYHCELCDETFCYSCRPYKKKTTCPECKDSVACSHCAGLNTCSECGAKSCRTCAKVKNLCQGCERHTCEKCGGIPSCVFCRGFFCSACSPKGNACDQCHKVVCGFCEHSGMKALKACQKCERSFCIECDDVESCETCGRDVCPDCSVTCEKSNLTNCKDCLQRIDNYFKGLW